MTNFEMVFGEAPSEEPVLIIASYPAPVCHGCGEECEFFACHYCTDGCDVCNSQSGAYRCLPCEPNDIWPR